jgi:hypothetical protein
LSSVTTTALALLFRCSLLWFRSFCHRLNDAVKMEMARLWVSLLLFFYEVVQLVLFLGFFKVHNLMLVKAETLTSQELRKAVKN